LKGLVHIYMGKGKGKTTAAVGLGVRACGRGLKVLMVQFLKSTDSGEIHALSNLPGFQIYRSGKVKGFFWMMNEEEKELLKEAVEECFNYAINSVRERSFDLLILDEMLGAIENGLLDLKAMIDFIDNKPHELELVLTGRNAPPELIEKADYVSQIGEVKHPMEKGIKARKGIEF
jgi:cob(I)alamin adenosyltransferase